MALVLKDRVKVTTTTTGTGAFAIGGAQFGFQGFSAFANGDTTYYTAVDNATGDWETGLGTYSAAGPSLARTQVLASSTGTAINFGAGPKDLFVVYPASRAVLTDGAVLTGPLSVPAGASGAQVPQAQEVGSLANTQLGITGQVAFFARSTAPTGWLKANGAAVSRTTYAALFDVIGTTFGAGDGSTTFGLPDMRGEFPRGWDDGRGVDSGRALGSAQGDAIRNITGAITGTHIRNNVATAGTGSGAIVTGANREAYTGNYLETTGTDRWDFNASRVVPTAAENRPRNIALLACIKF